MYEARITRANRTAVVILCDRSGSMAEPVILHGSVMQKAEAVAMIINQFIDELINRCRREEGIRDYFDIALLEYCGDRTRPLLAGENGFLSVAELSKRPVQIKTYIVDRTMPDGTPVKSVVPVRMWIEPKAEGDTPMGDALAQAEKLIRKWVSNPDNANSFPPIILNITDGEASDADCGALCERAESIKSVATSDGAVLLFNIHLATVSDRGAVSISFPSFPSDVPPQRYARLLYDMSSEMPPCYNETMTYLRPGASPPFRAMSYNCAVSDLFQLLNIGSISLKMTL